MLRLQEQPGIGSKALGVAQFDAKLWHIGRRWIAAHAEEVEIAMSMGDSGRDVYLATELYESGGHTALIGDFTKALATSGNEPQLVITDISSLNPLPLRPEIRCRVGVTQENIFVLTGPSLDERLEQLFQQLLVARPRRLFLFHHPHDPLPAVVCQSEISPQCILVHHADSIPGFGLFLPDLQIIDLNPVAVATSRWLGLNSRLLMPTAPDPGSRAGGFLERGNLVTATSGPAHKFTRNHTFSYPETIGVILKNSNGWHLHAGFLDEKILAEINRVLIREKIAPDKFRHYPWVPSLSAFLWEQQCDLYFSSFPVDGARTNAEVLASATPHLRYSARPATAIIGGEQIPDGLIWSRWDDLGDTLRRVANREVLEDISSKMRTHYERTHHPQVFSRTLHEIVDGSSAGDDPFALERDNRVVAGMLKAAIHTLQSIWLDTTDSSLAKKFATMEKHIDLNGSANDTINLQIAAAVKKQREQIEFLQVQNRKQRERIDLLQQKRRKLEDKVVVLEIENQNRAKGRGPRAWLWRWLTRY